ncbi:MAG: putative membrane protein [Granulosicoccus sp.]|jgi:putative membrane protein
MIKYNPKSWLSLIFTFHKSDTFQQMKWILLLLALYAFGITYVELRFQEQLGFKSTTSIHSLLGFVIGLLLVFRTNTAYDRWWEGRKQWGALVNNSRNLAIKINAMVPDNKKAKAFYQLMIPNYVFAMKEHLRGRVIPEELTFPNEEEGKEILAKEHIPNAIAVAMYKELHLLYKTEDITGDQLITIDKEMKSFTDIIGACERIKNTPIPYSYSLFIKKFIFLYIVTMPLGLVTDFRYWSVPIVCFVLYIFASLELIAEEIEDPFGKDFNDLPTDDLSKKIKANVEEILG